MIKILENLSFKLSYLYKITNANNKLPKIWPINGMAIMSFLPYLSLNEFATNPVKLAGRNIITSTIIEYLKNKLIHIFFFKRVIDMIKKIKNKLK